MRHNNDYIPYIQDSKILGVIYDNKLTYTKHINSKISLARSAYSTLIRFQHFHPKTRLHLFKMYVLPILTFSSIPLLLNGFKSPKKTPDFSKQAYQTNIQHSLGRLHKKTQHYMKISTYPLQRKQYTKPSTNIKKNSTTEDNISSTY